MNLVEYRASLDEVGIATEGYHGRWMWWSLWSFLGGATVSACSDPADPRTLPQLTRRNVERGIDWAVNDASLEAGIRIAKGYRGGHDTVAAEYASAVVSAAKRQLDPSLAILVRWSSVSRRCNQCLSIPSEQCRDEVDAAGSCMAGMQGCRLEAGAKHELDRQPGHPAAASLVFNACTDSQSSR